MWLSAIEYLRELVRLWWVFMICVVLAVVGGGYDFSQSTGITLFTVSHLWGRILWIIALVLFFAVAPFLVFHKVRQQRDDALSQLAPGKLSTCKARLMELSNELQVLRTNHELSLADCQEIIDKASAEVRQMLGDSFQHRFLNSVERRNRHHADIKHGIVSKYDLPIFLDLYSEWLDETADRIVEANLMQ